MKSQSDSQELDEIFDEQTIDDLEIPAWWVKEAKAKLLELALSCLPEKYTEDEIKRMFRMGNVKARAANAAIDTIEQNIRAKFQ